MTVTRITNVIVPEVFNPYVSVYTKDLFELYMSGMISTNPELDALAAKGGTLINMPFWNDLTGADEVLSETVPLTAGNITAGQDVAVLHARGRAFGANDLAGALAGSDPMKEIAKKVAFYKFRRLQALMISSLKGVIADNVANDSGDMVHSIASETVAGQSASTRASSDAIIDTITGTMGDAWKDITGMAVHSKVFKDLQKLQAIDFVTPADAQIKIPQFQGKTVVVDDNCPVRSGTTDGYVYTSYFFGEGAVGYGDGGAPVPSETDRDALQGDDYLVVRWHSLIHPRGVAWQASVVAGQFPTNTECENALNWDRVYERKNVRLAALVSN